MMLRNAGNFKTYSGIHRVEQAFAPQFNRDDGAMTQILLAEDDDVMREYLTRALEKSGYRVDSVDRGTAALALIESGTRYDLLLTDIVMPEMDGIELAQKAAIVDPSLRVMFITGFSAVTLKAGLAMPNAKVLSKPFHLKDLVMEVDRIFEVHSASGLN
jgi:two-component system, cell cycle response regulator CpdR